MAHGPRRFCLSMSIDEDPRRPMRRALMLQQVL